MRVRRRRHAHDVDPGKPERIGEREQRVGYPESVRPVTSSVGVPPDERSHLEEQGEHGKDISTEDLRMALRHYRSFFDRLLSI